MEQLASLLLHSRTQAHSFHVGVKGVGLIKLQPVSGLDTNNDIKNVIAYFDKLIAAVAKLRKEEKLQMSWLQNDIDTVVTLLYSTKYKLVNLQ